MRRHLVWPFRGTGWLVVLDVVGRVEAEEWAMWLREVPTGCSGVVLELSRAQLPPTWAVHALPSRGEPGIPVFVTGLAPGVSAPRGTIAAASPAALLSEMASVPNAPVTMHSPPVAVTSTSTSASASASGEVRHLRRQLASRTVIAQAQGVVQGRYGIFDAHAALALLKSVAQRHNLRLRHLASALLAARPPRASAGPWFPGRARTVPPSIALAGDWGASAANRAEALASVLAGVLNVTGTAMGVVRLIDPHDATLRTEAHRFPDDRLLSAWELADGTEPSGRRPPGAAAVTVLDTAVDPQYGEAWRSALLACGARTRHTVPLLAPDGRFVGEVCVHHAEPGVLPDAPSVRAVTSLGRAAGAWFQWHHRTVVLDALEDVHAGGRAATSAGSVRPLP
ncbi:ANTAR domain-containing protein [Streptomyces sp. NPDC048057]|uniref:ANTAR domain-containing protein n=1 Tax=Streptomyces sp. NPDC048057 TaxID=3155628 RepID=UPI0033EB1D98